MKKNTQIWTVFLLLCLSILIPCAFAAPGPNGNDTVQINLTINTVPNITTVVIDDYVTGVDGYMDLVAGNNATVYCIINATDYDGYLNINQSSLNVSIYYLARGYNATENPKYNFNLRWNDTLTDHYCINQSFGGAMWSDGSIIYNCSLGLPYFAENGTWVCNARIADYSFLATANNGTANVTQLIALNISKNSLNFGFLGLGQNTTTYSGSNINVSIENIGNVPISVNMTSGWNQTDILNDTYGMQCTTGFINESDIYFDDDGTYTPLITGAGWKNLTTGFTTATLMSLNESTNNTKVYYNMFWGMYLWASQFNAPQPKGICYGWVFFDALIR